MYHSVWTHICPGFSFEKTFDKINQELNETAVFEEISLRDADYWKYHSEEDIDSIFASFRSDDSRLKNISYIIRIKYDRVPVL